jgi:V/A-type H+-transporting ATPase subunit E
MENKVQEITDKIYREGVEKGQEEAQKIIDKAESEKNEILKKARQEAEKILNDARKQADELNRNTQSELKLYAGRTVEALKSEITNLINSSIVDASVKDAVTTEWLQKLMLTLASEWASREEVVIRTPDAESLKKYFAGKAKGLLDKGVKIEQVNGKPAGFAIMPADGSYKIQFGENEFAEYFREFLRPQLADMLFNK